jgi:hypothetical protein
MQLPYILALCSTKERQVWLDVCDYLGQVNTDFLPFDSHKPACGGEWTYGPGARKCLLKNATRKLIPHTYAVIFNFEAMTCPCNLQAALFSGCGETG